MYRARIVGTGRYLPNKIVSNNDICEIVDTTDAWIRERTGIFNRHIASEHETTTHLATIACQKALNAAQLQPIEIDLIVLATTTPDLIFPASACLLQERLGANHAFAFDVQAVCSGFIYALTIAQQFVERGSAHNALVVGADVFSNLLNWNDRNTCVLFGDGAGAAILQQSTKGGIMASKLFSDGRFNKILQVPGRVRNGRLTVPSFVAMDGKAVFKFAVTVLVDTIGYLLDSAKVHVDDVNWIIPHQANERIIRKISELSGISLERFIVTLDQHGNTSAASVPIALDTAIRDGRIQPGHKVLLLGVGGGMAWGGVLLEY